MKLFFQAGEGAKQIGIYYLFIAVGLRVFWVLFQAGAPPSQSQNPPGVAGLEQILFYVEMPGNLLARLVMFSAPDLWWLLYPAVLLLNLNLLVFVVDWLMKEH